MHKSSCLKSELFQIPGTPTIDNAPSRLTRLPFISKANFTFTGNTVLLKINP